MVRRFALAALAAAAAACGNNDNHGGSPDAAMADAREFHDAGPADSAAPAHGLTFQPYGTPLAFFQYYTTSSGAWHAPAAGSNGAYEIELAGSDAYELVAVCVDPDGNSYLQQYNRAYPEDGSGGTLTFYCFGDPAGSATVAVTGQMQQPGALWLAGIDRLYPGPDATSASGPWSFDVAVAPGTYDLVATGSAAIAIRHGVEIAAADALPAIDLAAEGAAYVPLPLTVTNQGSDAVGTEMQLLTLDGGIVELTTATSTATCRRARCSAPATRSRSRRPRRAWARARARRRTSAWRAARSARRRCRCPIGSPA